MRETPLLEITNLSSRGYPIACDEILSNISFSVARQSWYRITGDSGAGKSILLRTIAGLLPFAGSIRLNEIELQSTQLTAWRKRVCYVSASPPPLGDTIGLAIRLPFQWREAKPATEETILETLLKFDLNFSLDVLTSNLSTGERMRLALARATLIQPEVLLLDEPLAPLDRANRNRVIAAMKELTERVGVTILWVDHNSPELDIVSSNTIQLDRFSKREQQ